MGTFQSTGNRKLMKLTCLQAMMLFSGLLTTTQVSAQPASSLAKDMAAAANAFLTSLNVEQRGVTNVAYEDLVRFDWNYTPRSRKGITFREMRETQQKLAMGLVKTVLSADGYLKTEQIIELENVLRVLEKRPPNDTYRDPENYALLIFGDPQTPVWGWRIEGHHLSLHFSSVEGKIAFLPGFMGSNPAKVPVGMPFEGRRVLKPEMDIAFELLNSFTPEQNKEVILAQKAPHDIFTTNTRKALLETRQGLPMAKMTREQKNLFRKLIGIYLDRYHVTLKNQQWAQLEAKGLGEIRFAWMGDTRMEFGTGLGHYYRIHGPSILIEMDNTQNQGNHIHSVVRDLENDFGEDLLRLHYETKHR